MDGGHRRLEDDREAVRVRLRADVFCDPDFLAFDDVAVRPVPVGGVVREVMPFDPLRVSRGSRTDKAA